MSYDLRRGRKGTRAYIYTSDTSDQDILKHNVKGKLIRAKDYKAPKYTKNVSNGIGRNTKTEMQIITDDFIEIAYKDLPDSKILYAGEIWLIVDAEPDDKNIQKGYRQKRISTSTILTIRQ